MNERKTPLVSVLTPCYNSENFIARMLESVLHQTYPNIELICIDDGSVDNTGKIIKRYIPLFASMKKRLLYMRNEHMGQAAAINAGLKVIQGKYFTLLDSDDFLINTSIEKRVCALEEHSEYDIVASDYYIVNENDLTRVIGKGNDYIGNLSYQPHQFYLLLTGYSAVTPLGYLIRTEAMKKINPKMEINECIEGQNYQILIPLYYYYKRFYIQEALGYYVVRNQSHGHLKRSRQELKDRYTRLWQMLEEILSSMNLPEMEIQRYMGISMFRRRLEDI